MNKNHPPLLYAALLVALGVPAAAQQPEEGRSDWLSEAWHGWTGAQCRAFRRVFEKRQMTQLNWIEGKNLTIAYRLCGGSKEQHAAR